VFGLRSIQQMRERKRKKRRGADKNKEIYHYYTFLSRDYTYIKTNIMAAVAKLFDGHILNKSKENVDLNDEKYKGKVIGLYFSAHWYV
jgi:hypothetical protein